MNIYNFILLQLDRIKRLKWLLLALIIRPLIVIKKGRVFCWAYDFKKFSCNPMYISNFILENYPDNFEIFWAFNRKVDVSNIDKSIHIVYTHTIKYLLALYSSEFIITNSRNDKYSTFFKKKKSQKYIMTWHGTTPIKKIEKDASKSLSPAYMRKAKADSKMCDLMLSNSKFFTSLIRSSFWYDGEILEKGVPRNDIFYNSRMKAVIKANLKKSFCINFDKIKIILYAPTFRDDNNVNSIIHNWHNLLNKFEEKFNSNVCLFLRLHPNSIDYININTYLVDKRIVNMCYYHDMQELLCVADVLITDYSSCMFDFALMNKICFLYATDIDTYNRGFYFNLKELPFSLAENQSEILGNINSFNYDTYINNIKTYKDEIMCIRETGHSSEEVVKWMIERTK